MYRMLLCRTVLAGVLGISAFSSLYAQDTSWFSDATKETGLESARGFRINIVDINNDDYPDLILENGQSTISKRDKLTKLYLNTQNPQSDDPHDRLFVDITEGSGIFANPDQSQDSRVIDMITMADVNNDGFMDMVTGTYYHTLEGVSFPDDRFEVMLGDGQGHFTLVPNNGLHELGLIPAGGFTFLDYDQDGNIDLYISTLFQDLTNNVFIEDFLMKGNGDGTFRNATEEAGMLETKFPVHGATATDWNNDGWTDIMTSAYCRSSGSLWRNNGDGTFTDVAEEAGYSSQKMSGDVDGGVPRALCQWAALPADFDNDGDIDVTHVLVHGGLDANEGRTTVAINQGPEKGYRLEWDLARIKRDTPRSYHLGDQDGIWFDMDNDGWLDLAIAQAVYLPTTDRTYILRQNSEHFFDDITQEVGLLNLKETHNVRPFDYDLDGDEDLLVELWRKSGSVVSEIALVRNEVGTRNNHVTVKLIAPEGVNRNAIGARVTVYAGGMAQIRELRAGQGHFGAQQPLIQTVGLGTTTSIDSIVVRWPGNIPPTSVANPPANRLIAIDGAGLVVSVDEKPHNRDSHPVVSPNPASDIISLRWPEPLAVGTSVELYNLLGVRIGTYNVAAGKDTMAIAVQSLPVGTYTLRVVSGSTGSVHTFIRH